MRIGIDAGEDPTTATGAHTGEVPGDGGLWPLFSEQQDLAEQLAKAQVSGARSHQGFHMLWMVKEDNPRSLVRVI